MISLIKIDQDHCNSTLYQLPKGSELLGGYLYVYSEGGDPWLDFVFLEHAGSPRGEQQQFELVMQGSGALGSLKECRHTHWGEEGYIFYPNFKHIRLIIDWLEKQGFEGT